MPDESVRIRIRIGHKKTASRGWEHETTIEVEGEHSDVLRVDVNWWLLYLDQLGRDEDKRRDALDRGE